MNSKGLKLIDVNGVNLVHLFKNNGSGGLVVDRELLEVMAESGFKMLSLPFESGSQRIIDKYASRKWRIDKSDTTALIHVARELGITVLGNYTIGYPDETFEEIMETIMMAKRHVGEGLAVASFMVIVPFPGTDLFDMVVKERYLPPDFEPDDLRWTTSILVNTPVSAKTLEAIRTVAWKLVNRSEFVKNKESVGFQSLES